MQCPFTLFVQSLAPSIYLPVICSLFRPLNAPSPNRFHAIYLHKRRVSFICCILLFPLGLFRSFLLLPPCPYQCISPKDTCPVRLAFVCLLCQPELVFGLHYHWTDCVTNVDTSLAYIRDLYGGYSSTVLVRDPEY